MMMGIAKTTAAMNSHCIAYASLRLRPCSNCKPFMCSIKSEAIAPELLS
jgi:hypothetical protein